MPIASQPAAPLGKALIYFPLHHRPGHVAYYLPRAVCTGTAPSNAPTARPTVPVSYVPNPYFSFPYAQTSFDNRGQCTSAVSACSENYDICVSNLGGGGNHGVTIVVPGLGGTTVGGGGSNLGASATQVCSSLSSEACSNIQATQCSQYRAGGEGSAAMMSTPQASYCIVLAGTVAVAVALGGIL
jgi:hypothetical protein